MYLHELYNFHEYYRAPVPRQMLQHRGTVHCVSDKEHRPVHVPTSALHHASLAVPLSLFISLLSAKLLSPEEGNKWFTRGGKAPAISHMHPNQHSQAQDKDTKQSQGKPRTFLYS